MIKILAQAPRVAEVMRARANSQIRASSYKSSATGMLAGVESDAKLRVAARKKTLMSEKENSKLDSKPGENVGE